MRIFVINLKHADQRRRSMLTAFERVGIECELFEAIDGSIDDPRSPISLAERKGRYGISRSRSEMACFASHYALWQRCIALDEPIAIFEDDVVLLEGLDNALSQARALVGKNWIRLYGLEPAPAVVLRELADGLRLVQYLKGPEGTQAYVISPPAARRFVQHADPIVDPVDNYMDRFWEHDIPCMALLPWHVDDASVGSMIERGSKLKGLAKLGFKIARHFDNRTRRDWIRSNVAVGLQLAKADDPNAG